MEGRAGFGSALHLRMRDVFEEIFAQQPLDPTESARRNMRALKKRFYADAGVVADQHGFRVTLDGRPVRTPARRMLGAPREALALAMAAEWQAQQEFIEPGTMPLTRLANTILDGVAAAEPEVAAEIAKYLRSDLVCYRAPGPPRLVARQAAYWDPVLGFAERALGARFVVAEGIIHLDQPAAAVAAARAAIPNDAWCLGAVHAVTTLTGSALIALAVAAGHLGRDEAWAAAHVDEDWNMELWGRDELALKRRAFRFAEMTAAHLVLRELGTTH